MHIVYDVLKAERDGGFPNGLYKATQILFSYNSNRIEGSTITYVNTESIYEKRQLYVDADSVVRVDDITETENHFALFSFMLDTVREPLTETLIKEYQQLLKRNTLHERRYGSGAYKSIPNIVSDVATAQPYEVPEKMAALLEKYDAGEKTLETVLRFHCGFEKIHPFQDGNGRVGRMILFRECLLHDIAPFVVREETKGRYYDGIHAGQTAGDLSGLLAYAGEEQRWYGELAAPFVEHYRRTAPEAETEEDDLER